MSSDQKGAFEGHLQPVRSVKSQSRLKLGGQVWANCCRSNFDKQGLLCCVSIAYVKMNLVGILDGLNELENETAI